MRRLSRAVWLFLLSMVLCSGTHILAYTLLGPTSNVLPAHWMTILFTCQSVLCLATLILMAAYWVLGHCIRQPSPDLSASLSHVSMKELLEPPKAAYTVPGSPLGTQGTESIVRLRHVQRGFWWMLAATVSVLMADLLWAFCGVPSMWFLIVILPSPQALRCTTTAIALGLVVLCSVVQCAFDPRPEAAAVPGPGAPSSRTATALHAATALLPTFLMLLQVICSKHDGGSADAPHSDGASPSAECPPEATSRSSLAGDEAGRGPRGDGPCPPPLDLPGVVSDPAGATGAPDPGAGPGLSFSPMPAFRRARQMSLGEVLRADKEDLSLRMTGGCTELGSLPHASSMNCISSTFPKSHSSFSTSRSFVGLFYEAPDDPSVHFTYSVSTMIATGGFSNVYLGLCHSTGELVCLKQPAHGYSEEHITAMEAEVATLRTLDHPNIVRYLGTDRTNIFTILLEYVPGGSVASLLELFGPLEESVLRHYLWQVLHGLRYLHDRDIIHRDIKGANLLVSDKGVVKLTDFGSSLSDTYGDDVRRMILGTVLWMAPEVCLEQGSALASDIWSLGCTVLQMATARTPWSERQFEHSIAAFYHIATCDSPPKIPRRVPGPVRQFVLQCLALRPAARPTCAQLMRHAMFTEHGAAAAQPTIPVTEDEDFSPRWCHMRKRHSIGTSCSESPRPNRDPCRASSGTASPTLPPLPSARRNRGGLSSDLNL